MFSTVVSAIDLFVAGVSLNKTAEAMKGVYQVLSRKDYQSLLFVLRPLYQMVLNLLGVETTTASLSGSQSGSRASKGGSDDSSHLRNVIHGSIIADEEQEVLYSKQTHNVKAEFVMYVSQATILFYLHKFDACRRVVEKCYDLPPSEISMIAALHIQFLFLDAMSAICLLWKKSKSKKHVVTSKDVAKLKKKYVSIAEQCLGRLRAYGTSSPDLVDQKILMIEAELLVLSGQIDSALSIFQQAMDHCEGYDILGDKALACERCGDSLRASGHQDRALDYFEDCMSYYRDYGALMKVNHVKGNVIPGWDDE
jgi:hypothetical protein